MIYSAKKVGSRVQERDELFALAQFLLTCREFGWVLAAAQNFLRKNSFLGKGPDLGFQQLIALAESELHA